MRVEYIYTQTVISGDYTFRRLIMQFESRFRIPGSSAAVSRAEQAAATAYIKSDNYDHFRAVE